MAWVDAIMSKFRAGENRVLITTDIWARGIDVSQVCLRRPTLVVRTDALSQVSLVINYDLPSNRENYIHRIGRSGRYGRKGMLLLCIVPYHFE